MIKLNEVIIVLRIPVRKVHNVLFTHWQFNFLSSYLKHCTDVVGVHVTVDMNVHWKCYEPRNNQNVTIPINRNVFPSRPTSS